MDITYVVGIGPNMVQIPLLAFTSQDRARELLIGLGMVEGMYGFDGILIDGEVEDLYRVLHDEDMELAARVRNALFRKGEYYGGCGECSGFRLVTVPEGTPVVGWDLD